MPKRCEKSQPSLFVYGRWLRIRRRPGVLRDDTADPISIIAAEELIGDACEEVYGLLGSSPIRCVVFGDDGYLGEWPIEPRCEGMREGVDWREPGFTLLVQEATHCWAEAIGDWRSGPADLYFSRLSVTYLAPIAADLLVPCSASGPLTFRYPPFRSGGEFKQEATLLCHGQNGGLTGAAVHPSFRIDRPLNDCDVATAAFRARLDNLFLSLRKEHIFGKDIHGRGWAPKGGWDVIAEQVPPAVVESFDWRSAAQMSLCWSDTSYHGADAREAAAAELYNPTGWHEEYQDRVDEYAIPTAEAIISCCIHFDGPSDEERRRIGSAIVMLAPAAGLIAHWGGDPDRAIDISIGSEPEGLSSSSDPA